MSYNLNKIPKAALPPNGLSTSPKPKLNSDTASAPSASNLLVEKDNMFFKPNVKAIFSVTK